MKQKVSYMKAISFQAYMMALAHFIGFISQMVIYSYMHAVYVEHCYMEGILTDLGWFFFPPSVIIGMQKGANKTAPKWDIVY